MSPLANLALDGPRAPTVPREEPGPGIPASGVVSSEVRTGTRPLAMVLVLAGALLASSLASVYTQHQRRTRFIELQRLERVRDKLQVEWGKLQLEHSAWSNHDRIEKLARESLGLEVAPMSSVVLLTSRSARRAEP